MPAFKASSAADWSVGVDANRHDPKFSLVKLVNNATGESQSLEFSSHLSDVVRQELFKRARQLHSQANEGMLVGDSLTADSSSGRYNTRVRPKRMSIGETFCDNVTDGIYSDQPDHSQASSSKPAIRLPPIAVGGGGGGANGGGNAGGGDGEVQDLDGPGTLANEEAPAGSAPASPRGPSGAIGGALDQKGRAAKRWSKIRVSVAAGSGFIKLFSKVKEKVSSVAQNVVVARSLSPSWPRA